MSGQLPALDPAFADAIFAELSTLEIQLDADPLAYGPKRLNNKIALARKMLARCERIFLDVSQKQATYRRALRTAQLLFDLAMKNLLANDPEVRAGRAVSEREAIATGKLKDEVNAVANYQHAIDDLDAVLAVVKAKRSDLRDTQGRLRDQIRLCQEELGLGSRWGSKSPRGVELEPGQGFADGADVEDVNALIETVRGVSDAELHLPAEVDDTDPEDEQEAELVSSADDDEDDNDSYDLGVFSPPPKGKVRDDSVAAIPGTALVKEFGFIPHCEVCGEMQFRTPSGMQCPNGHGGADSVPPEEVDLGSAKEAQPAAADILPASSKQDDVSSFLSSNEDSGRPLTPREIEEADEDLDIDSILANFDE